MPEIVSPYKVTRIKFQRNYQRHGYVYRREIVDTSEMFDGSIKEQEMVNCYSLDTGHWIGTHKDARSLAVKFGLRDIQKADPEDSVASIGFNHTEKKWYGWSHRAICGFGKGDRIFEEKFGNDKTKFTKHGRKTIKTLEDAKLAAKRFARYVS